MIFCETDSKKCVCVHTKEETRRVRKLIFGKKHRKNVKLEKIARENI